jgi:hypothetical protein
MTRGYPCHGRARLSLLAIVSVAAILGLSAPAAAVAAVRYVDDTGGVNGTNNCTSQVVPCLTIQYAVDQAIAGDTIDLAAGTYSPGAVVDKPNLTIRGAGKASTHVTPTVALPRTFDLRGSADGVTIQDLRMYGPYTGAGAITDRSGVHVTNTAGLDVAGLTLRNLETTGFKYAIDVRYPGSATGWTLDSVDSRINEYGVRFWGATRNLSVSASHFDFNNFGLYAQHPGTTPKTPGVFDDIEIANTTFDGNATKSLYFEQGSNMDLHGLSVTTPPPPSPRADVNPGNGIDVNVKYGAFANVRIADSVFSGATDAGILLHGRNDGASYSPIPGSLDNVDLEGLTVTGNSAAPSAAGGINVSTATTNVSLTRSRIVGNGVGGGLITYADPGPGSTIDATNNWWGCNEGPTGNGSNACSTITQPGGFGTVDAAPWLVLSATASPSAIAIGGSTSDVTAALTTNSAGNPAGSPPDGPAVSFATDLGSVAPGGTQLVAGEATAVLTSGATAGTAHVTASLDAAQATAAVDVVAPPVGTAVPVVSGDAVVTGVLSCSLGAWTGADLTYVRQWLRDGVDVPGASGAAYATVDADIGHAVGCRVTATNAVGASVSQTGNEITVLPPAPDDADTASPELSDLWISRKNFRGGGEPTTPATPRRQYAPGTTIGYRISEDAAVTFTIRRTIAGRARVWRVGTLTRQDASGPNTLYISGRVRLRTLRPGTYRLTLQATDSAGNTSRAAVCRFTIVR